MAIGFKAGSRNSWRLVQALTVVWAIALTRLCLMKNHNWFYDDGFITLRYAQHLVEGLGPVWNRTGPPVEGFSSPLHLLLVAALIALGMDPIIAIRALSFVFHAALIIFIWRFVRRSSGSEAGVLAAALVMASWPLLLWDLGGLDAVPFAALLTMATLITLRYLESNTRRDVEFGGLLLGLAVFMRPDGAVVAALAFGACLVAGRRTLARRIFDILPGIVLFVLMVMPWVVFRLRYFHQWLPNTYYAKVYGIPLAWRVHSGLLYLRVYLTKAPYFILFLVPIAALLLWKRKVSRFDMALWACIAGYAAYLLDCGGDHMLAFRFITPMIPLIIVALLRAIASLGGLRTPLRAAAVSGALLFITWRQASVSLQNPGIRDTAGMYGEEVGRYVNVHWKPGSLVALNVAGATPYFADNLTYIDMLGLNDLQIARRNPVPISPEWVNLVGHLKGDGAYAFARRPDFIILAGSLGVPADYNGPGFHHFLGDYEFIRQPGFAAQYKLCTIPLTLSDYAFSQLHKSTSTQTVTFTYYQRRDLPDSCPQT